MFESKLSKKGIIIIVAALALALIVAVILAHVLKPDDSVMDADEWFAQYYNEKVAQFEKENEEHPYYDIVFIGDSLTDSYDVNEAFPSYIVANRGIGGDTTTGVIKRMNVSIYDVNPKLVVILIGANDVLQGRSDNYILNNCSKIIDMIQQHCPDTKILIQSFYPLSTGWEKAAATMQRLNPEMIEVAERYNCTYVDVYSALVDEGGAYLNPAYTEDGVHLNSAGQAVVTEVLSPYIEHLMRER